MSIECMLSLSICNVSSIRCHAYRRCAGIINFGRAGSIHSCPPPLTSRLLCPLGSPPSSQDVLDSFTGSWTLIPVRDAGGATTGCRGVLQQEMLPSGK